jgi:hypothetical protein
MTLSYDFWEERQEATVEYLKELSLVYLPGWSEENDEQILRFSRRWL